MSDPYVPLRGVRGRAEHSAEDAPGLERLEGTRGGGAIDRVGYGV